MAATWAATAPHPTAGLEVQRAGLGSGYGSSGSTPFIVIKWPGNKRAVLTKLTATGTYTTGGDALTPSAFGLKEIHAAFVVSSASSNVRPNVAAASGTPTINVTSTTAPKVQSFVVDTEIAAGGTVTGDVFHVVLVGI